MVPEKGPSGLSVTIILPVYDQAAYAGECIRSLLDLEGRKENIIVVDDGSTDGLEDVIKKFKVDYVRLTHRGKASAINHVLFGNFNIGELVFIAEADMIYDRHFLKEIIKVFDAPNVAGAIGRMYPLLEQEVISRIKKITLTTRRGREEKSYEPISAWIYRRDILKEMKGFNEDLSFHEDIALGQRVLEKGYSLSYVREALCWHREKESLTSLLNRQFLWGKAIPNFLLKGYRLPTIVKEILFIFFWSLSSIPCFFIGGYVGLFVWGSFTLLGTIGVIGLCLWRTSDVYSFLVPAFLYIQSMAYGIGLILGCFSFFLKWKKVNCEN